MPPKKAYERMEYEHAIHRTHQIFNIISKGKVFHSTLYFATTLYLVCPILLFLLVTGWGRQDGLGFRVYGRSIPL